MALGVDDVPAGRVVLKTTLLTVGTVGFVFCLTLMFLSMRAVMDVGGACAEGGAFEIRQPCPEGTAWIMPVAIFGGLASIGIGIAGIFRQGGPRPFAFAWSALFLSLGWNFLEYGVDPPDGGGLAWGWLVCAVVFVLMGGLPLVWLLSPGGIRLTLWGPGAPEGGAPAPPTARPTLRDLVTTVRDAPRKTRVAVADRVPSDRVPPDRVQSDRVPSDRSSPGDLVSQLERLAALRDRGAIDADEYETAKDAILQGEADR